MFSENGLHVEQSSKPLVLVVDDNASIRQLVSMVLTEQNIEVVTATDGDEALVYLEQHRPDIVLLDLSMPRVDGIEVLKAIRGSAELHDQCVLMLTAVANTSRFDEVSQFGPNGFVEKPFRIQELLTAINDALEKKGH